MQAEAVAKIKTEMDGNKNHPYVQVIGQFLLGHIQANPDDSSKIMDAEKTIAKSLDAMKAEAQKKQHNGMAMLTDAEVFGIVLKYFGMKGSRIVAPEAVASVATIPQERTLDSAEKFDVKLDDFLK